MSRRQVRESTTLRLLESVCGVGSLAIAVVVAAILAGGGRGFLLQRASLPSFLVGVFLGPVLAAVGSWLDAGRGRAGGVLLLVLAVLLAFDGMIATYLIAAPAFILVLASLIIAIIRRVSRGNPASSIE